MIPFQHFTRLFSLALAVVLGGLTAPASAQVPAGGELLWVRQLGTSNADYVSDVVCDSTGTCFVIGESCGSPGRECDIGLARFSSSGALLWTRVVGGPYSDRGISATVTTSPARLLVRCTGFGTVTFPPSSGSLFLEDELAFVATYSLAGGFVSATIDPLDAFDLPSRKAEYAPQSGAVECGWYDFALPLTGNKLTSAGGRDVYVAEYSPSGTLTWAVSCGGPGSDWATAVTFVPGQSACIVVGNFEGTATFPDSLEDADTLPEILTSLGATDLFIAKFALQDSDMDGISDLEEFFGP